MVNYAIVDYAGEIVKDGFPRAGECYKWLSDNYTAAYILEMQFKVIRKEEADETD